MPLLGCVSPIHFFTTAIAMDPEQLMLMAIEKCRAGLALGQSPFGCSIALDGQVIANAHNTVVLMTDITAHAEVNAIREACTHTGSIFLEGSIAATTCEPCPMCMSALHWARVKTVYFGATIDDAEEAGFNELTLPAQKLLDIGGSKVELIGPMMQDECRQLLADWKANPDHAVY